jgi:sigma-B regulation protein RsbU (phosphoserine phosphatase)
VKNSIATRLIAVLSLCSALILGVGMWLDYRLSREEILERLKNESQETIRAAIIDMENWLDGVEGSTLFLARILEQRDYTHAGLEQMLKDIVENNADIYGSTIALNPVITESPGGFAPYYFHRDGILTYADLATEEYAYQEQAWYLDAVNAGKPVWVEPYFDRGGGETLMTTFAVPVFRVSAQGERFLYAVVTADVPLDELRAYLRRLRLGDSGFATLLSRTGIILSSRNPDYIMRHYSDARSDTVDLPTWRDMLQSALAGQAVTRQLECPDIIGRCVIRMDTLQSTGWPVGMIYSEHEITAPLRRYQIRTAVIGLVTLLLMALAVYLVTRRLTRPLTVLVGASDNIARGKLDTALPTVRGEDEIAQLVMSFDAMRRDLKTYISDLETATASRSRLEGELAAAREIQMSLLPGGGEVLEQHEGYSLWARVRPAKSVGGDLYTYQQSGERLFIAVGDVSDKGVPAALFMAKATSLIQQLLAAGESPVTALAKLNNALEAGNDNCMFVTLFLGVVDLASLELEFASAGHTPPSLLRDARVGVLPQDDGPALGLAPGLEFPRNKVQLAFGDRLAIYTDGIDEAFNEAAQMFGPERFNRGFGDGATLPLEQAGAALFDAVDEHAGDTPQSDDITLLLLELPVQGDSRSTSRGVFPAGEGLAGRVITWLQTALEEQALAPDVSVETVLVAEEISTNIEKYGELPAGSEVLLDLSISASTLAMEFSDRGVAFDPLRDGKRSELGADIESAEIGGLGVHLITQLTDEQSYRHEGGGNILRVVKLLDTDSA